MGNRTGAPDAVDDGHRLLREVPSAESARTAPEREGTDLYVGKLKSAPSAVLAVSPGSPMRRPALPDVTLAFCEKARGLRVAATLDDLQWRAMKSHAPFPRVDDLGSNAVVGICVRGAHGAAVIMGSITRTDLHLSFVRGTREEKAVLFKSLILHVQAVLRGLLARADHHHRHDDSEPAPTRNFMKVPGCTAGPSTPRLLVTISDAGLDDVEWCKSLGFPDAREGLRAAAMSTSREFFILHADM
jgi:hypothetical protein